MPRVARITPGGVCFHVLNRSNLKRRIFNDEGDYSTFVKVLAEARERTGMRILAYAVMPSHWHLVLWPEESDQLGRFMMWLTGTHVRRWHHNRRSAGSGHLYQGRYRSFPIQADDHLLTVARYVEQNPLRARLVERSQDWPWSSLLGRRRKGADRPELADWPVARPPRWTRLVNEPIDAGVLEDLRTCAHRGRPYGTPDWRRETAERLGLQSTMRPRGRPRKKPG